MEKRIQTHLSQLEEHYKIRILFACEAGSRAWGVPSANSDYDIRVIYSHPVEWYLSVNDKPDNISINTEEIFDIQAWDFKKALGLLSQSNTILYEWLRSPIIYKSCPNFLSQIIPLSEKYYQDRKSIYHYLGLSNALIKKHFEKETIPLKKYFIIIRSILAALWINEHQSPAPILFTDLLPIVEGRPKTLLAIHQLMRLKKETKEGKLIQRIESLNQFLIEQRRACSMYAESLPVATIDDGEGIDLFFRGMVMR